MDEKFKNGLDKCVERIVEATLTSSEKFTEAEGVFKDCLLNVIKAAAKEAFSKALGTGVRGFTLRDVELLRDELGKPYYVFSGKAVDIVEDKKLLAHVSVTDEGDSVIVFTVLETV